MRTLLVGAVESTLVALETLVALDVGPLTVVTLPLSRRGRHSDWVDLRPTAAAHRIDVIEATNINDVDLLDHLSLLAPDLTFVIGWSQICGPDVLRLAGLGTIGFHPSPLPENRGRAVIPWTILQRTKETGCTLFWMDEGMDSGDVLAQETFAVAPDRTATWLYRQHMEALSRLLERAIAWLRAGTAPRHPQDHRRATWCAKRTPTDGLIDWASPAEDVWTLIRAVTDPYPGAFSFLDGRKITIWAADHAGPGPFWGLPGQVQAVDEWGATVRCGDGNHVLLRVVQPEGAPRCQAADQLRLHARLGIDRGPVPQTSVGQST